MEFRDGWIPFISYAGDDELKKLCSLMPEQFVLTEEEKSSKHIDYHMVISRGLALVKRDERRHELMVLANVLFRQMRMAPQIRNLKESFHIALLEAYGEIDTLFYQVHSDVIRSTRNFWFYPLDQLVRIETDTYLISTLHSTSQPIRHQSYTPPRWKKHFITTLRDGIERRYQVKKDRLVIYGVESLIHRRIQTHYHLLKSILTAGFAPELWSLVADYCAFPTKP